MDEEIIIEGDQETHHHYEGGCCEHCAAHAERIVQLEGSIDQLRTEIMEALGRAGHAESQAEEAIVQAELAQEVAEASAIVAIEAIDQATEPEEESIDGSNDIGDDVGPGPETSSQEPITVQVEPEKPKQAKQPGYGFRRGRG
jgi:hypothetical protein